MTEKFFEMIEKGVSPYHTVNACEEQLKKSGFQTLELTEKWELQQGGAYVVNHHGSSLIAFGIPENMTEQSKFRMAAAHTDFPCLRIKPNPEMTSGGYMQVNTEVYGGAILNTWLDRPLSVAGRVALRSEDIFQPKMASIDFKRPILTIPNLAIHMNRDVNKGIELNKQKDMIPLAGMLDQTLNEKHFFIEALAKELHVEAEDILDFELNLYCAEAPVYVGLCEDMISAPRIDNLSSVTVIMQALQKYVAGGEKQTEDICLAALFDHEEVGSSTKQGAGSMLLRDVMEKILLSLGHEKEQVLSAFYHSMLLSVDVAHAMHPNKMEKTDVTNKPVMNKGFCIKEASTQSYATDSEAIAVVEQICQKRGIAYQKFANRSDERGGGTLGAIASRLLPIKTVDIGVGMLAMHSARELMGKADLNCLYEVVEAFYEI